MALTKIDVVNMLCEDLDIPRKESLQLLESLFELIKSELEKGNTVMVSGFGKWSVKHKRERKGRNPQTGESITISSRNVITFNTSMALKNKINKKA